MAFKHPNQLIQDLVNTAPYHPRDVFEFHLKFEKPAPTMPDFPDLRRRLDFVGEIATKAQEMLAVRRVAGHCTMPCFHLAVQVINILADLQADLRNQDLVPDDLTLVWVRFRDARATAEAVLEDIQRKAWCVSGFAWIFKFVVYAIFTILISAILSHHISPTSTFAAIIPLVPYFITGFWMWVETFAKKKAGLHEESEEIATWCLKATALIEGFLVRSVIPFVEHAA